MSVYWSGLQLVIEMAKVCIVKAALRSFNERQVFVMDAHNNFPWDFVYDEQV